jgi:hypothetical protein
MNLAEFIAASRVSFAANPDRVRSNPNMSDSDSMDNWRVTLEHAGRTYTLVYSKGYGHKGAPPTVHEVLDCLRSEATYPDMPFEEWCRELGYDEDSRKAERAYQACVKQTEHTRRLIGDELWTDFLDAEPA